MSTSITIESRGRRHYLIGNTYPMRDALRAAGAHWDPDARAWWIGKHDVAAAIVAKFAGSAESSLSGAISPSSPNPSPSDRLADDTKVLGRARYKGREYLLLWEGETRKGRAAKLAFTDGSKTFWADAAEVEVTKTYRAREWRGRAEPMTFGRLRRLREEYSAREKAARNCELIGERGAYTANFDAIKQDRAPGIPLGTVTWLRHRAVRLAVVLVGYEPATYVRSEDAEDMGHYDVQSGWYGVAHYRDATIEEYEQIQAESHREDGTCAAIGRAVVEAFAAVAAP